MSSEIQQKQEKSGSIPPDQKSALTFLHENAKQVHHLWSGYFKEPPRTAQEYRELMEFLKTVSQTVKGISDQIQHLLDQ